MKRAFVFALLAVLPASALLAQAGPPMGGVQNPGQGVAPPAAALGNPGQQPAAGGVFGQNQAAGIGGGNIGGAGPGNAGLAAGGAPAGGAQIAGGAGPAAGAPAAGGVATETTVNTATTSQATVVSGQSLSAIQQPWMINKVIHHCVSRDFEQHFGGSPLFAPMVGFNPVMPFAIPAFGDLELVGVGMVSDMHDTTGPIYRVTLKNNSPLPVIGVRVSLIAVLGQLDRSSPVVTAVVKEIAAGGIATIDVPMPVTVMQLGPATAQVPFETLIASIDSFNELPETSEFNNVVTVTRGNIAVIESAQTTATATTTTVAAAGGVVPAAAAGAAPAGGAAPAVAAPGAAAAPAQVDGAAAPMAAAANPQDKALENLNLENVENASAPE